MSLPSIRKLALFVAFAAAAPVATYACVGSDTPAASEPAEASVIVYTLPDGGPATEADTGASTTTPDAGPPVRRVFVTKTKIGSKGGLAKFDQTCADAMNDAGVHGTFKAWASSMQENAKDRTDIRHPGVRYALLNDLPLASSGDDLLESHGLVPINVNELGLTQGSTDVWTGTNEKGVFTTNGNCTNWMSPTGAEVATIGNTQFPVSNPKWTTGNTTTCDEQASVYCFEVDAP